MFEKIPAPVKGQPARASWGAALTSRVNELCAMAPARGLARDGLTGTGFAALPSNRRERVAKAADLSCFCIKPSPKQEDAGALAFCNCFVSDGMVFEQVIEDGSYRVDQFVLQGELEEGREYTDDDRPYVYVRFYGGDHDINAQKTLEDVREIAKDPTQGTVLLLYKLKHDGSVAIDFRNMPIFQHVEAV